MTLFLIQVIAFIVAIGILIAVHEFGHFWVARRLGFKVLRFAIGFGKPLWRRVGADGVEYVLGAIPLGGYVKMLDEREGTVAAADLPGAFNRRPVTHRIAVLVAGPAANFLFAILVFWALFMIGVPGIRPVVGDVQVNSIAAQAGLRSGDEILRVAGTPTATREAVVLGLIEEVVDDGAVRLTVRDGQGGERALELQVPPERRLALTEPGAWADGLGFEFTRPWVPAVVGELTPTGPARAAGLQVGDTVVAVNGERVDNFSALVTVIRQHPGETIYLDVRRGANDLRVPVPVAAELDNGVTIGRIGIGIRSEGPVTWPADMQRVERHGPFAAIAPAIVETWSKSALTVKFLWRMLTGEVSVKNISGPISIAAYAGFSALGGITVFLNFLALISISLGVLNLLPIPILDGGQVVYQLAEAVKGGPLSDRTQLFGQQLGIALLILLMGLAFYNDLARHFG